MTMDYRSVRGSCSFYGTEHELLKIISTHFGGKPDTRRTAERLDVHCDVGERLYW